MMWTTVAVVAHLLVAVHSASTEPAQAQHIDCDSPEPLAACEFNLWDDSDSRQLRAPVDGSRLHDAWSQLDASAVMVRNFATNLTQGRCGVTISGLQVGSFYALSCRTRHLGGAWSYKHKTFFSSREGASGSFLSVLPRDPVYATAGSEVKVTCEESGHCSLNPPARLLSYDNTSSNSCSGRVSVGATPGGSSGLVWCHDSDDTGRVVDARAVPVLTFSPSTEPPRLLLSKPRYFHGDVLLATCTVSPSLPPPVITWLVDCDVVEGGDVEDVVGDAWRWPWTPEGRTQVYVKRVEVGDDGRRLTCAARWPDGTEMKTAMKMRVEQRIPGFLRAVLYGILAGVVLIVLVLLLAYGAVLSASPGKVSRQSVAYTRYRGHHLSQPRDVMVEPSCGDDVIHVAATHQPPRSCDKARCNNANREYERLLRKTQRHKLKTVKNPILCDKEDKSLSNGIRRSDVSDYRTTEPLRNGTGNSSNGIAETNISRGSLKKSASRIVHNEESTTSKSNAEFDDTLIGIEVHDVRVDTIPELVKTVDEPVYHQNGVTIQSVTLKPSPGIEDRNGDASVSISNAVQENVTRMKEDILKAASTGTKQPSSVRDFQYCKSEPLTPDLALSQTELRSKPRDYAVVGRKRKSSKMAADRPAVRYDSLEFYSSLRETII